MLKFNTLLPHQYNYEKSVGVHMKKRIKDKTDSITSAVSMWSPE